MRRSAGMHVHGAGAAICRRGAAEAGGLMRALSDRGLPATIRFRSCLLLKKNRGGRIMCVLLPVGASLWRRTRPQRDKLSTCCAWLPRNPSMRPLGGRHHALPRSLSAPLSKRHLTCASILASRSLSPSPPLSRAIEHGGEAAGALHGLSGHGGATGEGEVCVPRWLGHPMRLTLPRRPGGLSPPSPHWYPRRMRAPFPLITSSAGG